MRGKWHTDDVLSQPIFICGFFEKELKFIVSRKMDQVNLIHEAPV